MMVIDADYFKSLADLPDGFERINRMFGEMMQERDDARDIASAAGRGHRAQTSANIALKERVDELLAANGDLVQRRQASNDHLRAVLRETVARSPAADKAAEFLGMSVPPVPAVSGNDGEA